MKTSVMSMTPFKTKILIDQYEHMGYALKTGDTLYTKKSDGNYAVYGELIKFDSEIKCWLAKCGSLRSFPISKINHFIEIVVIPFDQYVRKVSDKGFNGRKNEQGTTS